MVKKTSKGRGEEEQEEEKGEKKFEGGLIKPFVTDSGCTRDLPSNIFSLAGQLVALGGDEGFAVNRCFTVGIINCI